MRLGGFVIHGNNADTLGACLQSLQAVCDQVVALDSHSTDGSAQLAQAAGVTTGNHRWRGYGHARATAAAMLADCDYLTFLDADERYSPGSAEALLRWKKDGPRGPYFRLLRHDWAELPTGRFRFRPLHQYRLFRRDTAVWTPQMVVHESVPKHFGPGPVLPGVEIDHRFATTLERRRDKEERYALLWAVQAFAHGKRARPPGRQRWAHVTRNALIKGALFRGGRAGWTLSTTVAEYHVRKYVHLRALQRGGHPQLVQAYAEERYAELFRLLDQVR